MSPAPRGVPQIEVTFDIDANGIVHVTAKDKGTGKENTIKIQEGSGLSQEEIDRMIKDAEVHAEEDKKRREEQEVRNQAESLVYQTRKSVEDYSDKIPENVKTNIEDAANGVEEALKSDDLDQLKTAMEKLTTEAQEMGKAIYEAESAGAAGDTSTGTTTEDSDPNVVDAEVVDEEEDKK